MLDLIREELPEAGVPDKQFISFNFEKMGSALCVELDCDIYITGSNARLLSGELATNLAGHGIREAVFGGFFPGEEYQS